MLRAEPDVFCPVASDPTVFRLIDALVAAGPKALTAIRPARAKVRSRVWELAGMRGPAADGPVTVDIDGVLVLAHSEKQDATATWKKAFGHHPLVAFVDHGQAIHQAVLKIPKKAWTPAYDAGGTERPGVWAAEITDMPGLSSWPEGMRLIVRKERPYPSAQL